MVQKDLSENYVQFLVKKKISVWTYSLLTRSIPVQLFSPNGKVCSQELNFRQSNMSVKAKVSYFTKWFHRMF